MSKPQVTLTFAGDSTQLERTFGQVGSAAKGMQDKVGEAGKSFDTAREGFDKAEQRAMGFRDTITGVQDSVGGLARVMKGDLSGDAFLQVGMGIGDLASGFANLLVPALAAGTTSIKAMSLAILTSPVTWIVLAIAALVAIVVLIATKTTWFQTIWRVAWGGIKSAASAVWDWLKGLPESIGRTFSRIAAFISAPFRAAFNFVSDAWNNTIGSLSWTVPGWVPFIGGDTISAPRLPHFHAGGVVPGTPGQEVMAVLQAGERVTPAGGASGAVLQLRSSGNRVDDLLMEILARAVKGRGGNVQVAVMGR